MVEFQEIAQSSKLTMMGAANQSKISNVQPSSSQAKTIRRDGNVVLLVPLVLWIWGKYSKRNKNFDRPTNREKDAIWRMINDDKTNNFN